MPSRTGGGAGTIYTAEDQANELLGTEIMPPPSIASGYSSPAPAPTPTQPPPATAVASEQQYAPAPSLSSAPAGGYDQIQVAGNVGGQTAQPLPWSSTASPPPSPNVGPYTGPNYLSEPVGDLAAMPSQRGFGGPSLDRFLQQDDPIVLEAPLPTYSNASFNAMERRSTPSYSPHSTPYSREPYPGSPADLSQRREIGNMEPQFGRMIEPAPAPNVDPYVSQLPRTGNPTQAVAGPDYEAPPIPYDDPWAWRISPSNVMGGSPNLDGSGGTDIELIRASQQPGGLVGLGHSAQSPSPTIANDASTTPPQTGPFGWTLDGLAPVGGWLEDRGEGYSREGYNGPAAQNQQAQSDRLGPDTSRLLDQIGNGPFVTRRSVPVEGFVGTQDPGKTASEPVAEGQALPSRTTLVMNPDMTLASRERTSDAFTAGTGGQDDLYDQTDPVTGQTKKAIMGAFYTMVDDGAGGSALARVTPAPGTTQAIKEAGGDVWQLDDTEFDTLVESGLIDEADRSALVGKPLAISKEWVDALGGNVTYQDVAAPPPVDTSSGGSSGGSGGYSNRSSGSRSYDGGGYSSRGGGYGGGGGYSGGGGFDPAAFFGPAFMGGQFAAEGDSGRAAPFDNPIFDRYFATANGGMRRMGRRRGKRGRTTFPRRGSAQMPDVSTTMRRGGGDAGGSNLDRARKLQER